MDALAQQPEASPDGPAATTRAAARVVPVRLAPEAAAGPGGRGIAARPTAARSRPDPAAMRLAGGFVGLATASAIVGAMLAPAPIDSAAGTTAVLAPAASLQVIHVRQYIKLKPGQTAPPQAVVQQPAAPAPRIVKVVTKQSGVKP